VDGKELGTYETMERRVHLCRGPEYIVANTNDPNYVQLDKCT